MAGQLSKIENDSNAILGVHPWTQSTILHNAAPVVLVVVVVLAVVLTTAIGVTHNADDLLQHQNRAEHGLRYASGGVHREWTAATKGRV